jgi:hypothetical protein
VSTRSYEPLTNFVSQCCNAVFGSLLPSALRSIRPRESAIIPCDILLFLRLICFSFSLFSAAFADFLIKLRLCPFDLGSSLLLMAAKEVEANRQRCVQWEEGTRRLC